MLIFDSGAGHQGKRGWDDLPNSFYFWMIRAQVANILYTTPCLPPIPHNSVFQHILSYCSFYRSLILKNSFSIVLRKLG
jgi:hypothetical protein